jgi:hypothetical protein
MTIVIISVRGGGLLLLIIIIIINEELLISSLFLRQEKSSQKCNATNYPTENKRPQKISSPCGSQQPTRCVVAERERFCGL